MPWISEAADSALTVITAIAGAVGTVFALRRRFASDNSTIAEGKAGTGLLHTLQTERDSLMHRLQEISEAREKQFGACEERVRSLSEQVLDLRLANGRLLQVLAQHDKAAADRFLVEQLRPGPAGKGDEPP